jgi:hypothetical protein
MVYTSRKLRWVERGDGYGLLGLLALLLPSMRPRLSKKRGVKDWL